TLASLLFPTRRSSDLNGLISSDRLARVLPRFPADLRFSLVVSRAVGNPEEWLPSLKPYLADGARIGLFQGSPAAPRIDGFDDSRSEEHTSELQSPDQH